MVSPGNRPWTTTQGSVAKAISYLSSDNDDESWSRFDNYHRSALQRLETSGADFALIASNTAHHRFETIVQGIRVPVVSILDAVAKESFRIGARQVLLLGTAITMRSPKFREAFAKYRVEANGPLDEMARSMTADLINDLQRGKTSRAAKRLGRIARLSLGQFNQQSAVGLVCTELPLVFPKMRTLGIFEYEGILYINANVVHINAAFDFAIEPS